MSVWKPLLLPRDDRRPLLILDRDGVVIVDADYLADPEGVELVPGAAEAIARARAAGWIVLGVSNQSGIGRGRFTEADLASVMARLDDLLAAAGAAFDGFYYCPHAPGEGCACRKPAAGLLAEAGVLAGLEARRAVLVGDKPSDIALGRSLGAASYLVRTGYGSESEPEVRRIWAGDVSVLFADDLAAVAAAILAEDEGAGRDR